MIPEADFGLVDAHIHLWDTRSFDLPWLNAVPQLRTQYTAAEFADGLDGVRLRAAVAVQAGNTAAEATWLLSSARAASALTQAQIGVVLQYARSPDRPLSPWHPLVFADGRFPQGVRLPLVELPTDWTALGGIQELVGYVEHHGLVLELLLRPDQLRAAGELSARHPRLTVVLCHLGLGENEPDGTWQNEIARLAARKNVAAKISGLHTSHPPVPEDHRRARLAAEWALEQWGPDRLMFGSDWPVSTRAGRYTDVLEWTKQALGASSPTELQAMLGLTAASIYKLAGSEPDVQIDKR
ncbi:amidohydrolase family protein [Nocardioides marmorisolisilvae]|uniref:Amidohydrolase-related domain-containing protein n=1 Tax=Nocardioides marmorisolisilvae TaxID=1542737 RepID=A0A3N0DPQ0_9ACTN|nr:amidohydrolase family protein [Nocardioides marmorisolisilvae]RNL77628.1 hypothetical protein EFL95_16605 [Nocardioides marmorisolisilvae]